MFSPSPGGIHGIVATDSQSLIDTILDKPWCTSTAVRVDETHTPTLGKHVQHIPLDPMFPEWDIIRGIQVLLLSMPSLTLQHVKGHQDRHLQYNRLPLLAQLNVDADEQATRFQTVHGCFQPDVLHTAWSGVHLVLPIGTITSHVETAKFHATAPPLKAYYMAQRYGWTPQTLATVNWKAHGTCLRKHLSKKTHLVKFVHGILPTNSILHRREPIRSRCPRCTRVLETWQHIWQCCHITREQWRIQMLTAVTTECTKLRTMPALQRLLTKAIRQWLVHDPSSDVSFQMSVEGYTSAVRRVIFQQNAIGWDHIFQGRFSVSWGALQDDYYARQARITDTELKCITGNYWQAMVIEIIWRQWFQLWNIRNNDLHGADKNAKAQAERQEVERALRDIYDIKMQLEPSVQQLLCKDITDNFSKPVWYNRNWLAIHAPLAYASLKRAKARAIQGVRSIRSYFKPG